MAVGDDDVVAEIGRLSRTAPTSECANLNGNRVLVKRIVIDFVAGVTGGRATPQRQSPKGVDEGIVVECPVWPGDNERVPLGDVAKFNIADNRPVCRAAVARIINLKANGIGAQRNIMDDAIF